MTIINNIDIKENMLTIYYKGISPTNHKYLCNPASSQEQNLNCIESEDGNFNSLEECKKGCHASNTGTQYPTADNICYYKGIVWSQGDKPISWLGTFDIKVNNKLETECCCYNKFIRSYKCD